MPLSLGELVALLTHCRLGRGPPRIKWYPDPSSRLATIDMGRKGGGAAVPLSEGATGLHLTHCVLGRGLPPNQVAS